MCPAWWVGTPGGQVRASCLPLNDVPSVSFIICVLSFSHSFIFWAPRFSLLNFILCLFFSLVVCMPSLSYSSVMRVLSVISLSKYMYVPYVSNPSFVRRLLAKPRAVSPLQFAAFVHL